MSGNQSRSHSLMSAPLSIALFIAVVSPRWAMRFRALAWRDQGEAAPRVVVLLGVAMALCLGCVSLGAGPVAARASAAGRPAPAASSRALASCVARVLLSQALSSLLVVLDG